jgi:hypothetical protein
MKQAMVRKAMWDWVYQSYLMTNRRQLSNHQQLLSTHPSSFKLPALSAPRDNNEQDQRPD